MPALSNLAKRMMAYVVVMAIAVAILGVRDKERDALSGATFASATRTQPDPALRALEQARDRLAQDYRRCMDSLDRAPDRFEVGPSYRNHSEAELRALIRAQREQACRALGQLSR